MSEAGWGILCHYLGPLPVSNGGCELSAEAWNEWIDAFDVPGLARQLASTRCGYFFITLGQNSGHYLAPNATYDRLTKITPSKCSRRDIVSELYEHLAPVGIRLCAYIPSGAPAADTVAMDALGWEWGFEGGWPGGWGTRTGKRHVEFQRNWEAVLADWSRRFGEKVSAWWIDGCYFADEMYRFDDEPNFFSLAGAARSGNSDALVAFNPGVINPVLRHTPAEDFTAGEINRDFPVLRERFIHGAQAHILTYLGDMWCAGERPELNTEFVCAYVKQLRRAGAAITFDVPIERSGLIRESFMTQLRAIE